MTSEQREMISRIIGFLWTLGSVPKHDFSEPAYDFAEDLEKLLDEDKGSKPGPYYGPAVEDND